MSFDELSDYCDRVGFPREYRDERERVLDEACREAAEEWAGPDAGMVRLWMCCWLQFPIASDQLAFIRAEFQKRWSERKEQR